MCRIVFRREIEPYLPLNVSGPVKLFPEVHDFDKITRGNGKKGNLQDLSRRNPFVRGLCRSLSVYYRVRRKDVVQ